MGHGDEGFTNNFFLFFNICHTSPSFKIIAHMTHVWYIPHMTLHSLPFEPRKIVATEARLNKIYEAAKLGLKGDALALASGMLPTEYRQLCELDPIADMAALKGKADGELEMSKCLHKAATEGDAKAALAILQHSHGWVAKQSISIDVDQRISIIGALRQAESRIVNMGTIDEAPQRGNDAGLLINNRNKDGHDYTNSNANAAALSVRLQPNHGAVHTQSED